MSQHQGLKEREEEKSQAKEGLKGKDNSGKTANFKTVEQTVFTKKGKSK